MNIILCGLPACGKTTVGKIVAEKLARKHIDTDDLITQNYHSPNSTCKHICIQEGENYFRRFESLQIKTLTDIKKSVISTGGGSLFYFDNDKVLQSIGRLVYLKTDPSIIWKRICERGLLSWLNRHQPEKHFYRVMQRRRSKLESIADIIIETANLTPQEIAGHILHFLERDYGE